MSIWWKQPTFTTIPFKFISEYILKHLKEVKSNAPTHSESKNIQSRRECAWAFATNERKTSVSSSRKKCQYFSRIFLLFISNNRFHSPPSRSIFSFVFLYVYRHTHRAPTKRSFLTAEEKITALWQIHTWNFFTKLIFYYYFWPKLFVPSIQMNIMFFFVLKRFSRFWQNHFLNTFFACKRVVRIWHKVANNIL